MGWISGVFDDKIIFTFRDSSMVEQEAVKIAALKRNFKMITGLIRGNPQKGKSRANSNV